SASSISFLCRPSKKSGSLDQNTLSIETGQLLVTIDSEERPALCRFVDEDSVNNYIGGASRDGLTPSPTCQTWARWFSCKGDAATSATKQVARLVSLLGD